jgi:hypothetical protein
MSYVGFLQNCLQLLKQYYLCNLCIFIMRFMYYYFSTTLTEVFLCFLLSYKAIARVQLAKSGHGPHSSKIFVLFSKFLFYSMYCLFCVVLCIVYV